MKSNTKQIQEDTITFTLELPRVVPGHTTTQALVASLVRLIDQLYELRDHNFEPHSTEGSITITYAPAEMPASLAAAAFKGEQVYAAERRRIINQQDAYINNANKGLRDPSRTLPDNLKMVRSEED